MSESKHTPGPWIYHEGYIKSSALLDNDRPDRGREVIAEVYNHDNAHLIAAAPEMESALMAAEESLATIVALYGKFEHGEILAQVRAALAKAKGE